MTDRPYITCRELIEFLSDYLDDALPAHERQDFERHLGVCPSCVAYLETYRQAVALGKSALACTDAPADAAVPESLIRAVRAARTAR